MGLVHAVGLGQPSISETESPEVIKLYGAFVLPYDVSKLVLALIYKYATNAFEKINVYVYVWREGVREGGEEGREGE